MIEDTGYYGDTEGQDQVDIDKQTRAGMAGLYGEEFPLTKDGQVEDKDWASWAQNLWDHRSGSVQNRLHLIERNRLFRKGIQWVSATGLGPWREPPKPRDAARVVHNMIKPALDQRVQIIAEQRPGFKTRPQSQSQDDMKRAEAQQIFLEYQYDQQKMANIIREMAYWAGTDGIAFGEVFWNPDAGPWDDLLGTGQAQAIGDIDCRVRRIEQVRVSENASANEKPWFWIIREVIPLGSAVLQYGSEVTDDLDETVNFDTSRSSVPGIRMGYQIPGHDEMYRDQRMVERLTVYCEKSEFLPQGLTLIIVGKTVALQGPLFMGQVPIFRWTDGSADPNFYPEPIMDTWIDSQMQVNAVLSKWIENVRYNAGPKLLAKQNSIVGETLTSGTMTVIDVKGLGDISTSVRPMEGMSLAADAKELLQFRIKAFEDLSGWNDTSRGQFASDQSGRAILAIREQLERVFAPCVNAAADAMVQWAEITLGWGAWGYDTTRDIGVTSASRPDLATSISKQDINGAVNVWIDAETMMPLPRALKTFLLDQMYDRQLISAQEYRQRNQFAFVRDFHYPDDDHAARAKRVAESIRQTGNPQALPILWMDNEAIHQDVLERELLLPDDVPQNIRSAAFQRWMALGQQMAMKQGQMAQGQANMPQGGQGQPPQANQVKQLPAATRPLPGTNPGVASANAAALTGPDANRSARQFDQMPH